MMTLLVESAMTLVVVMLLSLVVSQWLFKLTCLLPKLLFKPQIVQMRILLRPFRHVFVPHTPWHLRSPLINNLLFWRTTQTLPKPKRHQQLVRIEALSLALGLLSVILTRDMSSLIPLLLLGYWLILTAEIDQEQQLILDSLSLPLLWLGLLLNNYFGWVTLEKALLGAVVGYVLLWSVYQVHFAITRREGMGYGDFKLTAALGAWVGIDYLPMLLIAAAGSALVVSLWRQLHKQASLKKPLAFGPHLAIAGWLMTMMMLMKH